MVVAEKGPRLRLVGPVVLKKRVGIRSSAKQKVKKE